MLIAYQARGAAGGDLLLEDFDAALRDAVPFASLAGDDIQRMRDWARTHARPA